MTVETRSLKFPMEWKAFIQVVVIIAMLIGASVAGVQVTMNVDFASRVEAIESRLDAPVNSSLSGLLKPYTEIISMVDLYYVRQNGTDGRLILPFSTNKTYVQQQSLGNVTTGSVYLKEMTLASGITYGSTVLIIQQYQGQLSYYSDNALVYSVKAGALNATVVLAGVLNASTNYVQAYRLLIENRTDFPSTVSSGYMCIRIDWNKVCFYNGTDWTNCTTSTDDDSMYLLSSEASNFLFRNGTKTLTANWNLGGSYGVYGATWVNSTNINLSGNLYFNQGEAINMTLWSGSSLPATAKAGQPFFLTTNGTMWYYNVTWLPWVGATGATGPAGAVNGLPFSYMVFNNATSNYMVNGTTGTIEYYSTNASKVSQFALDNLTTSRTWMESIVWKGNFTFDTTVVTPDYTTLVRYGARFELGADIDRMWTSEAYGTGYTRYITVLGGIDDGNKASRTSGSGWEGCFRDSHFEDMTIMAMEEYGMNLQSFSADSKSLGNTLSQMWFGTGGLGDANKGGGLLISNTTTYGGADNTVTQSFFINNGDFQIRIEESCANNRVTLCHFAGVSDTEETDCDGIELWGDVDLFLLDQSHFEQIELNGIKIMPQSGDFADHIKILNTAFYCVGRLTNNTYDAIWVDSNVGQSRMGLISGNSFSSDGDINEPKYAIDLDGANSDYWQIMGNTVQTSGYATASVNDESGGTTKPTTLGDFNILM